MLGTARATTCPSEIPRGRSCLGTRGHSAGSSVWTCLAGRARLGRSALGFGAARAEPSMAADPRRGRGGGPQEPLRLDGRGPGPGSGRPAGVGVRRRVRDPPPELRRPPPLAGGGRRVSAASRKPFDGARRDVDPCDSATGRPAVPTRTQRARSGPFAVPSPPSWNSGSRSRPSVRSLAGSTGRRRSKHGTAAPPLRTTLSPLGPHGGVPPRATPRSPHDPQGSPITRERGLSYCGAAKGACRGERSRPRHRPLPSDSRAQGGDGLGGYQSFAREVPILTRSDPSWEWGGRRESRGRIVPKDPEAAGPPVSPGEGGSFGSDYDDG